MIDWDKPIRKKSGERMTLVHTLDSALSHPRIVVNSNNMVYDEYTDEGYFLRGGNKAEDLENVPEEGYVLFIRHAEGRLLMASGCFDCPKVFSSREEAYEYSRDCPEKTQIVKVEI